MGTKSSSLVAEMVGTFALIFIGAGAVTVHAWSGGAVSLVGIAFAHGLTVMAMIYAFGHISGTHINPAVTVGMLVAKKIDAGTAVQYIVCQLIGATIAAMCLKAIFPSQPGSLGACALANGIPSCSGFLVEAILTFFLVTVIFGSAVDERAPKGFAGIAIGLTITLDIFMGGPLTGAALNPARAFGPAVASGAWADHWLYWAGPITGSVAAALLYQGVFKSK